MNDHPVILFDGVCNFCNSSVNFVIRHDKKSRFRFAPLQSENGKALLLPFGFSGDRLDTFILVEKGQLFTRSTAALKVCRQLDGWWPALYAFIIVPRFIRDGIYDFIARHRYQWFGKKETCMIPTPETRQRFL